MAVILMYHRIIDVKGDPYRLAVSPQHFNQHLEYIQEKVQPIRLSVLVHALRQGKVPDRAVVITIDDGYLDNTLNPLPILRRIQMPATVFVTSGYINSVQDFWGMSWHACF